MSEPTEVEARNAGPAGCIDHDYRRAMIEAAGLAMVERLTRMCLDESKALIQRVLLRSASPSAAFPAEEVAACHRLAGSCAAVGLKAMSQAWYALEQASSPQADAATDWRSAWERAQISTLETAQACATAVQVRP